MDKTDLSLGLSALSVLAYFVGPVAAVVAVAFVVGIVVGRNWSD